MFRWKLFAHAEERTSTSPGRCHVGASLARDLGVYRALLQPSAVPFRVWELLARHGCPAVGPSMASGMRLQFMASTTATEVTGGFNVRYCGPVAGHGFAASQEFVRRAGRPALSTTRGNTVDSLQRVCALSNDHVFVHQRWSTLAATSIATSFDRRATIALAEASRNN